MFKTTFNSRFQSTPVRVGGLEGRDGELGLEPLEVVAPALCRGQQGQRAQRELSGEAEDQGRGGQVRQTH